jgi:predicted CopG family antitoxin
MLGKEHLLPSDFRKTIPYSTINGWKNNLFSSYHGYEHVKFIDKGIDYAEIYKKYQNLEKLCLGIIKCWISVSNVIIPLLEKKKENTTLLLNSIQYLSQFIPQKTVLKLMGYSSQKFKYKIQNHFKTCSLSVLNQCYKQHRNQLAKSEIYKIKTLFEDTTLACWNASSIYYYGLRNNIIGMSLTTFYKYVRILGLKRSFKKLKILKIVEPTTQPNEKIHVDTTFWELETCKAAIAFVSDNFSRKILGSSIQIGNSSINVEKAIDKAIKTIRKEHEVLTKEIKLIADGGSENHAQNIVRLLDKNKDIQITKLTAKKDVVYSNSPIEAINKIAKQYLRHFKPKTMIELFKVINFFIEDHNNRNYRFLKGRTPNEMYIRTPEIDYSQTIKQATEKRKLENNLISCKGIC